MNSKSMHHFNIEFLKPTIGVAIAYSLSLADVSEVIKILSACVALGYGIWKWRNDVKK